MPFLVSDLRYAYDALDPYIDSETVHLHHDKHHQTYADNLNAIVQKTPELASKSAEDILRDLSAVPEAICGAVRNNGGGYSNHNIYWQIIGPNEGGQPVGAIASAINHTFGSFTQFQERFNDAAAKQFGSGWGWLVFDGKGLQVLSTSNQDSPLSLGMYPVMTNDVWEHAYYLKYKNRRVEYLKNWWNVVNWPEVNKRYSQAFSL